MKTWKKIEDAKKRTNDIAMSKKRNEDKVHKVFNRSLISLPFVENLRPSAQHRGAKVEVADQLCDSEAASRGKAEDLGSHIPIQERGSQIIQGREGTA